MRHVMDVLPWSRSAGLGVAGLVMTSLISAMAEAMLMALIALTATTLAADNQSPLETDLWGGLSVTIELPQAITVMLIALLVRTLSQLGVVYLPVKLSADVQLQLRRQLVDAYIYTTWARQAAEPGGFLQEIATGHISQVASLIRRIAEGIAAGLSVAVLIAASLLVQPAAAAIALLLPISVSLALRPISRSARRESGEVSAASIWMSNRIRELTRFTRLIHPYATYDGHEKRVDESALDLRNHYMRARVLSATVPALYQVLILLAIVGGLGLAASFPRASLAGAGAVLLLLLRAAAYGQKLQQSYQAINELSAFAERLSSVMRAYRQHPQPSGARRLRKFRELEVKNVGFHYRSRDPNEARKGLVLKQASFSIKRGETVALAGRSGVGKSTLMDILAGLLTPTTGAVLINGRPREAFDQTNLSRHIAYVSQDTPLLDATVEENIRYLRPEIEHAAVRESAKVAGILDEIESWPDSFDTEVGDESGRRVSGGQRKRLGLARALAGSPQVLLLDEPTSSLDDLTERLIIAALEKLRGRVAMVIASHSSSLLALCDRVYDVNDGELWLRHTKPSGETR